MGFSCCIVDCKNTTSNSQYKFYRFPTIAHRIPQRNQWIFEMRRKSANGSSWEPTLSDRICSNHFIGNIKSDSELSPNYSPIKFPDRIRIMNEEASLQRHERFMQRRMQNYEKEKSVRVNMSIEKEEVEFEYENLNVLPEPVVNKSNSVDKECLVEECQFKMEPLMKYTHLGKVLMCNKFVTVTIDSSTNTHTVVNDAETQTYIVKGKGLIPSQKKRKNKSCGTIPKVYADKSVSVEPQQLGQGRPYFRGYESLQKEEQLLDLAGVSYGNYDFLLERTLVPSDNCKLSRKDRLFIFLMKLKTGLSYSWLGVLFSVHRTTISNIFISTLQHLASTTANLVFWPSKAQVQGTMPKCFYPDSKNTRVIIDCTEFRIECPAGVDDRIFSFSRYKKGYTAKVLIGIPPGGFICLKSKVNGGRTTDSQLTIESGLIDLLEEGDVVLADKGFPEIRKIIDKSGKSALVFLPPFLENKKEFSKEETGETYKVARVRIHVERAIQRLKIYKILDLVPASLFHYMDDLLHIICALVNLQPPIHREDDTENSVK